MNPQDQDQFVKMLSSVHAFYRQDVSDFALQIWWLAMKPFDLPAVSNALNRHIMNPDSGQFMPKPADVVRMLQGSTKDSALVAWSKVDRAIRSVGTYESVVFDDPLIHCVITEMGGWVALGNKKENEWPFIRAEFENRYRGYTSRKELPAYVKVLIGMAQSQNDQVGFRSLPPMLVGDHAKAKMVFDGGSKAIEGFARLPHAAFFAGKMIERHKEAA